MTMSDYAKKKNKFDGMVTLYGRKTVLEVLRDSSISIYRVHLAASNRNSDTIEEIEALAKKREVEICYHDKAALSRISKNGRQDQGVAIDVESESYMDISQTSQSTGDLIGLDNITNPQNLGMVIRSVAASPMGGLLLPKKGCARIDPLVHKASAGNLFKATIYHTTTLEKGLKFLKSANFDLIALTGASGTSLLELPLHSDRRRIFLLGNESSGLRESIRRSCDIEAFIPMRNNVESINVAAAATLVAFRGMIR